MCGWRLRLGCLLAGGVALASAGDERGQQVPRLDGDRHWGGAIERGASRRLEASTEPPPMFWASVCLVMVGLLLPGFFCRAVQLRYKSAESDAAREDEADASEKEAADAEQAAAAAADPDPTPNFSAYESDLGAPATQERNEDRSEASADTEKAAREKEELEQLSALNWTSPEDEGEIFVEQTGPKQDPPKFLQMMLRPEDAALSIQESRKSKDRQEAVQPYPDEKPKVPLQVALRQFSEIVYTEQGPRSEAPIADVTSSDPAIVSEHLQQLDLSGLVCGSTCGTGTSCWLAAALCGSRAAQGAPRPPSPGRGETVARPPRVPSQT